MAEGGGILVERLKTESGRLFVVQSVGMALYVIFLVAIGLGNLFGTTLRAAPTPLPRSFGIVWMTVLLPTTVVSGAVFALAKIAPHLGPMVHRGSLTERWSDSGEEHSRRDGGESDEPDARKSLGPRGLALAAEFALGFALLVVLPTKMPLEYLTLLLAALTGAGAAVWWTRPVSEFPEIGLGVSLVAYPGTVSAALSLPVSVSGAALSPTQAVAVALLSWLSLPAVAVLVILNRRIDWRIGLPMAVALLLVGAAAYGMAGQVPEPADPRTTVHTVEEVDPSTTRPVYLGGSDHLVQTEVVQIGRQEVHNPANRTQIVEVPDVRACLFTPERHELEVRQGSLDTGYDPPTHYPIDSRHRMAPDETRTAELRLDVGDLDNSTLSTLGTVPVVVRDTCPEKSDGLQLVIYTTDGYNPRGPG
jgi:hypothetical protein